MSTGSSVRFILAAFCGVSQILAAVNMDEAAHHAYFGTGLLASGLWLLNNTPDSALFTLFGAGFIGIALLRGKKNVRR
jgi:hypothetical protein